MRDGMRADLISCGDPFPDLSFIHHSVRGLAFGHIPLVVFSDQSSNYELDGTEPVAHQRIKAVFKRRFAAVVKCDNNFLIGIFFPQICVESAGVEASVFKRLQLDLKFCVLT